MVSQFTFSSTTRLPIHKLEVILGSHTAKAFVAAPKEFHVMGIVKIGMEYGWLAKTDTGDYLRVNGSCVQRLDSHSVETAIARIRTTGRGESYAASRLHELRAPMQRCMPTITHRKHRKIERQGPTRGS